MEDFVNGQKAPTGPIQPLVVDMGATSEPREFGGNVWASLKKALAHGSMHHRLVSFFFWETPPIYLVNPRSA